MKVYGEGRTYTREEYDRMEKEKSFSPGLTWTDMSGNLRTTKVPIGEYKTSPEGQGSSKGALAEYVNLAAPVTGVSEPPMVRDAIAKDITGAAIADEEYNAMTNDDLLERLKQDLPDISEEQLQEYMLRAKQALGEPEELPSLDLSAVDLSNRRNRR